MVHENVEPNSDLISPIWMLHEDEKRTEKADVSGKNLPCYEPSASQSDIWSGYQGKLGYQMAKEQMKINTSEIQYMQRLEYERKLQDLRFCYKAYLQMISGTVYSDADGNLFFALETADKIKIVAKKLLNVSCYKTRFFVSYYPEIQTMLEVSWGKEERSQIFFSFDDAGIAPNVFLKKLKSHGIFLSVSGRTEKMAAEALLAYSLSIAETEEISAMHGWIKRANLEWHYAGRDEITMEEYRENE